jgi:hypothetical protein
LALEEHAPCSVEDRDPLGEQAGEAFGELGHVNESSRGHRA